MKYDFETLQQRRDGSAEKWNKMIRAGYTDPEIVPFSVADMEFMAAPEILEALREKAEFGVFGYTSVDCSYREAVCRWMEQRHGWQTQPEWQVQTGGVVAAIGAAIRAFTQPGDGILIQPPIYPPFHRLVVQNDRVVLENPLQYENGRYTMDFDDLEEKAKTAKMLLLCSPHNPVGRVWTKEELQKVAEICNRHHVLVFSDEIHFDFVYPGHTHTVYATLSETCRENCIVGTAASKSFNLAGLSTSNIIIPNEKLRDQFARQSFLEAGRLNHYFGTAATKAAYEKGAGWLDELLVYLEENMLFCQQFLEKHFPKVTVSPLEGTYLLWADFRSFGLDAKALEQFMTQEAGLFLDEGWIFGKQGEGFERINLACPRRYLQSALERLRKAAEQRGFCS
ncbi:MAG: pyridoxal phosphate-dependent aminotransferase [Oscillospiraceae bacterium]|nr:pyridoxal phosphate-dependent aminotransferase [Oscillospiraceae bacterium]